MTSTWLGNELNKFAVLDSKRKIIETFRLKLSAMEFARKLSSKNFGEVFIVIETSNL